MCIIFRFFSKPIKLKSQKTTNKYLGRYVEVGVIWSSSGIAGSLALIFFIVMLKLGRVTGILATSTSACRPRSQNVYGNGMLVYLLISVCITIRYDAYVSLSYDPSISISGKSYRVK
jgi:hypothetical protein